METRLRALLEPAIIIIIIIIIIIFIIIVIIIIIIIIINNIYITFTIRTSTTYNTLEYKREKKPVTFPTMTCKKSCVKSYKAQRKVIYSPKLQTYCQLKFSIYCNSVHLN